MAALGSGTLVLEKSCLWLGNGADRDLIIWPALYRLETRSGRLTVVDPTGAEFGQIGDAIALAGGELNGAGSTIDVNLWVESKIGETVPVACRLRRYWDAAGSAVDAP